MILVIEQIRDQVIDKCISHALRRKSLEEGRELKLDKLRELARAKEESDVQAKQMEGLKSDINRLAVIDQKGRQPLKYVSPPNKVSDSVCFSCGHHGHFSKDPKCPAKGNRCLKCNGLNHFQKQCKTKSSQKQSVKKTHVRQVEECLPEYQGSSNADYAFSIQGGESPDFGTVMANVGGIDMSLIIESGTSCKVVDRHMRKNSNRKELNVPQMLM